MVALELLFLIAFWTWAGSAILFLRHTFLPRLPIFQTPDARGLSVEAVQFQATDGLRLEGWKVPSDPARPWIILCHGLGTNRADLLDIAAGLHQARFNLFLFDFRAHGNSAGHVSSFGWREQRDLEGALVFLGQQPEVPARPYGIYGISMGASVALMVAARDERLGAIAVDSPYTTLEESLARHLTLMYPLPKVPFVWLILATYRLRFGVWPSQVSPLEAAATLAPRPLFLMNGGRDPRMPPEGAKRIFERAGTPKDLWIIEGAGHLEGPSMNFRVYLERLSGFFEQYLR